MRSSFAGLEMSKRTIQISQKTLDIATNNMANIMTKGYTRQRVDTNAMYLSSYKNWQTRQSRLSLAGQGVNAFGVAQIRDSYLDKRYREMNSHLAELNIKIPVYEELQTTFDLYENVGMDVMIARFKESLSKYATNSADDPTLANIVRENAYNITVMLNTYHRDFTKLLNDNVYALEETIGYVNSLVEKVVDLNKAIVKQYKASEFGNVNSGKGVSAYGPLELIDTRNLLIDELSQYMNLKVEENSDGSIKLWMGDVLMVNNEKYEHIVMENYDSFGAAVLKASNGQSFNIRSGEIKGYLELVNGSGPYANAYQSSSYGIPYYIQAIDAFAESFADLFNRTNGADEDPDNNWRLMFGSSLDVYDAFGNLVERGAISASTIKISEMWSKDNATMIGQPFKVVDTRSTTFTLAALQPSTPYSVNVNIGGVTQTVWFTTSAAAEPSVSAGLLNDAIITAFGLDADSVVVSSAGVMATEINGDRVTIAPDYELDFSKFVPPNTQFNLKIVIGDQEKFITFTSGASAADTVADLNDKIRDAFGFAAAVDVFNPATGQLMTTIDDELIIIGRAGSNFPADAILTPGFVLSAINYSGFLGSETSETNLDGNHAHTLMLALDKSINYGRALDFKGTVFEYVAFLTNRIGQNIQLMDDQQKNFLVTTNNLLDSRDAISGVSNDEEGINMLIYQKWYNAAARMMTALDECLDRVINQMGRVGL